MNESNSCMYREAKVRLKSTVVIRGTGKFCCKAFTLEQPNSVH